MDVMSGVVMSVMSGVLCSFMWLELLMMLEIRVPL